MQPNSSDPTSLPAGVPVDRRNSAPRPTPGSGSVPVRNPGWLRRGYATFEKIVTTSEKPIVLLEGSRDVPPALELKMEKLAAHLIRTFPKLVARSGNARGSDQAWARGVNTVDPTRLQLVLPTPNYRPAAMEAGNQTLALQEAPPEDFYAARRLTRENYAFGERQGPDVYDDLPPFKQNYLDRDALKVLGVTDYMGRRMKATVALFYLNPAKRNGGGTGHTLRLCEAEGVPYFLSDDWFTWT